MYGKIYTFGRGRGQSKCYELIFYEGKNECGYCGTITMMGRMCIEPCEPSASNAYNRIKISVFNGIGDAIIIRVEGVDIVSNAGSGDNAE